MRWYLEEFPKFPFGPDRQIAVHAEQRMEQLGTSLWQEIFERSPETTEIWQVVRDNLDETRIEIETDPETDLLPWELLRDPTLGSPLAVSARAFVRIMPALHKRPQSPNSAPPVRILLVISRPRGPSDVPYRSVARHLFEALAGNPDQFRVDVLRPATFSALEQALRNAQRHGEPYHVVHFDGHGGYAVYAVPNDPPVGYGYLVFERPDSPDNEEPIDGTTLGSLLAETGVPLLILNACRSAYAEASGSPATEDDEAAEVRAFSSLAQDVMASGVLGVVAMRYIVYVVTAVEFMAKLYGLLILGCPLAEAVTRARTHLHDDRSRELREVEVGFQDWSVPVVYESGITQPLISAVGEIDTADTSDASVSRSTYEELIQHLPPSPATGFVGRDDAVLILDRVFDTANVALLHGNAASGKTATAVEFGRWYARTGGVPVPVIFTSFERPRPLSRVLDDFEFVLRPMIQATGVIWPAITDDQRRAVVLRLLQIVPVLWIWDNVEEIAGFPTASNATLVPAEKRELADFLRAATGTRGRFLLTSRRLEHDWLDAEPVRIPLRGMPLWESVELAHAIAAAWGKALENIEPWKPLLEYAKGNPLVIRVLVGQALEKGLETADELEGFLSLVQAGEAELDDDEEEGRTQSLGAALSYGFAHAFSEEERALLALLHLFQGYVTIEQLMWVGHPEAEWSVPSLRRVGPDDLAALLDRAADIGFLTRIAAGLYEIHPALPWYLRRLFHQHYPEAASGPEQLTAEIAISAYVRAMAQWSNFWHNAYEIHSGVVWQFAMAEANLLWAWKLSLRNNLTDQIVPLMQGLRALYSQRGEWVRWRRMVEEISAAFVSPNEQHQGPMHHQEWAIVLGYLVDIEAMMRNWPEVERLGRLLVDGERRHVSRLLALPLDDLGGFDRHRLTMLATALDKLGSARRELQHDDCLALLKEAYDLYSRIGDRAGMAVSASNIAGAYAQVESIRDLNLAEAWYEQSLALHSPTNHLMRAACYGGLGFVELMRFQACRETNQPFADGRAYLLRARQRYREALAILPTDTIDQTDAIYELGTSHAQLGTICGWLVSYFNLSDVDETMRHYRQAMDYLRTMGDTIGVAGLQFNAAIFLFSQERWNEALAYAEAALPAMTLLGELGIDKVRILMNMVTEIRQRFALGEN
jgi:tetratricopeptide (TPR) repeat protein